MDIFPSIAAYVEAIQKHQELCYYNSMQTDLLILSAFEPELLPIKEALGSNSQVHFACVGIGLVEASYKTADILKNYSPKTTKVIFVGSSGASSKDIPLLTPVVANEVRLLDASILKDESYLPPPLEKSFLPDEELRKLLFEVSSEVQVGLFYSALGITKCDIDAETIQRSVGSAFENLEIASVAAVSIKMGFSFACFSVVTNYLGSLSHFQWQEHHNEAAKKTANLLSLFIERESTRKIASHSS